MGRVMASLFDSTRRLCESSTADTSITRQQVGKMSVLKWCQKDWEALCSAAPQGQTVRELTLSSTRGARLDQWWQWLAYGFFSKRARTNSFLEVMSLTAIQSMTTAEIDAFCAILASQHPEEELLGCPCGPAGVQDATLVANSPIRWDLNELNEPVLSSEDLKVDTAIPFLRILSESNYSGWLDALVPGYGRSQVQRKDLVLGEQVDTVPGKNLKALEISWGVPEDVIA
ncbi:hypothetical protein P3T76_006083 [Phytophthora citrophthora]|uniref:Uncharacterized protein n=1 Tax=Phytophthora citrophthora TaxID=4793 RepID=A0AAD9GPJ0_9STRA|nr:hypothetical protein P3T76_006083 [Phytophthora citrophthora]